MKEARFINSCSQRSCTEMQIFLCNSLHLARAIDCW